MDAGLEHAAEAARTEIEEFRRTFAALEAAVHKRVVGQDALVRGTITALACGGHVLLEGAPGLAKTLLVRTLASALDLGFSRIQFTPDLMPADITGTQVLHATEGGGHVLRFEPGPLHAHCVLADEINRATPRTQSALLEAMQEHTVTVGRETRALPQPFMVLATQNPVEQEGTYPLPEAQLDRFLFKLLVPYPREEDYHLILSRTTGSEEVAVEHVADAAQVRALQATVRRVAVPESARKMAIHLVMATQPGSSLAPEVVNRCVALGSSPRGAQALILGGKVRALLDGRAALSTADVRATAADALRHRVMLNFRGHAEHQTGDRIVTEVLEAVRAD